MKNKVNKIHILYLLFVFFISLLFRDSTVIIGKVLYNSQYKISIDKDKQPIRSKVVIKNNMGVIADRKPIKVIDTLNIVKNSKEV